MKWITKYAANDVAGNLSSKFRAKRIILLTELLETAKIDKHSRILDIGGTNYFWQQIINNDEERLNVVLVNIARSVIEGFKGIIGDAKNLAFLKSNSVDFIFSNSLIEHLENYENQKIFSIEVQRITKYYFIQTPAYIFPFEPHFLFPFFHWLPFSLRLFLHQHFNLGWYRKESNINKAKKLVKEIRIMKKRELSKMFPNSKIYTERFSLLPKSYIVTNLGL